jgi:hypothetical protein
VKECALVSNAPPGRSQHDLKIRIGSDEPVAVDGQPTARILVGVVAEPLALLIQGTLSRPRFHPTPRRLQNSRPMLHPFGIRPSRDKLANERASLFDRVILE